MSKHPRAWVTFKNIKYRYLLPLVSTVAIPAFLNHVRWWWRHSKWLVHPETQALLEAEKPLIFAMWHGQMFTLVHPQWLKLKHLPHVLISQSRDGQFITDVAHHIGFTNTIRGAHGRGGTEAALRIRQLLLEQHGTLICLADGPKGPRHKAKIGIVSLAQQLGVPIVPVAGVAQAHWFKFNSAWDAFEIPTMFLPITVKLGAPIDLPKGFSRSDCTALVNETMQAHFRECLAEFPNNPKNRFLDE